MERAVYIYEPKKSPENIFIRQIWSAKDPQTVKRSEKVLPKGTAEIIFNLSEDTSFYTLQEKKAFYLPNCFINGVNSKPIHLSIQNTSNFIGIQFNVFALKYIFNIPSVEFTDRIWEGPLICKSLDDLAEKLKNFHSFNEQVEAVFKWFNFKIKDYPKHAISNRMIKLGSDSTIVHLSVKEISEKYNVTPRHLSRLCIEYLGMCTEDVILYQKYLSSLYQIHQVKESLTQISYNSGFYDQPHFARTFKLFTGLTPRQYKKSKGDLPGHIFEISKEDVTDI